MSTGVERLPVGKQEERLSQYKASGDKYQARQVKNEELKKVRLAGHYVKACGLVADCEQKQEEVKAELKKLEVQELEALQVTQAARFAKLLQDQVMKLEALRKHVFKKADLAKAMSEQRALEKATQYQKYREELLIKLSLTDEERKTIRVEKRAMAKIAKTDVQESLLSRFGELDQELDQELGIGYDSGYSRTELLKLQNAKLDKVIVELEQKKNNPLQSQSDKIKSCRIMDLAIKFMVFHGFHITGLYEKPVMMEVRIKDQARGFFSFHNTQ